MKTNSQKPNRKIWMGAMIGIALVALFAQPRTASGQQWTSPDGSGNIWNTNTGNVGIGTSSPGASRLTVSTSGASDNPLTLINTAPTGFSQMVLQGTGRIWGINVGNASNASVPNKFSIFDAGAAAYRFVIDTSGNVGIGTTSPRTTLHITSGASGVLPYNYVSGITVGTL